MANGMNMTSMPISNSMNVRLIQVVVVALVTIAKCLAKGFEARILRRFLET